MRKEIGGIRIDVFQIGDPEILIQNRALQGGTFCGAIQTGGIGQGDFPLDHRPPDPRAELELPAQYQRPPDHGRGSSAGQGQFIYHPPESFRQLVLEGHGYRSFSNPIRLPDQRRDATEL